MIKLTECPRDAMQGLGDFVPTELKIEYLNLLLEVGFDRLDFGSFVSPKAIPQLKDTAEVLEGLKLNSKTELLAIIANTKGAENASQYESIKYLGFPFSVSETFQLRNTNATREQALDRIKEIQDIITKSNQKALIYLSMGFGNPYGDPWNTEIVLEWASKIVDLGIEHFSLADTIGNSSPEIIKDLYPQLVKQFDQVEWGMHLHSAPGGKTIEKIEAALEAGCERLDSAIKGFGGCPMAKDDLVGNMATEAILNILNERNIDSGINKEKFQIAYDFSNKIFLNYH